MLEGYFKEISKQCDSGLSVEGSDGIHRTHKRNRAITLRTVAGDISILRETYGARGSSSLAPLDGVLNIPQNKYSHRVAKRVAEEAAKGSYDDVTDTIKRLGDIDVPKRQAEELTATSALDFEAFYKKRQSEVLSSAANNDHGDNILVATTDGKGIVMLPESLTPVTQKAAACEKHKLDKRLSSGEKTNRKRMALVASVYEIAPFLRTPEDFIRELRPVRDVKLKRPRPFNKRVWAGIKKPAKEVIEEVFEEVVHRHQGRKTMLCILIDGNLPQLNNMNHFIKENNIETIIIIDIIHVIEYLWDAAWCFFEKGNREAERWVNEKILEVLKGNCSRVAASIRRLATIKSLSKKKRKNVDICANYLLKYKKHMRYNEYLEQGMPIATGVIEGACRYLVKDRMDITGAKWSLEGAESVLRLRALRASGDFKEYWRFHEQQELSRNHLRRYANGEVAQMPAW